MSPACCPSTRKDATALTFARLGRAASNAAQFADGGGGQFLALEPGGALGAGPVADGDGGHPSSVPEVSGAG